MKNFASYLQQCSQTIFNRIGGENGSRTHDLRFRRPLLYPLSYSPKYTMAARPGLEPRLTGPESAVLPLHHRANN